MLMTSAFKMARQRTASQTPLLNISKASVNVVALKMLKRHKIMLMSMVVLKALVTFFMAARGK